MAKRQFNNHILYFIRSLLKESQVEVLSFA